jgi:hypothetical protein
MIDTTVIANQSSVASSRSIQTSGRILALAFVWAWISHPEAQAADYWVGPKGRDAAGLGSQTRPWATLQYAADRVHVGDTVHVRDGRYQGFDLRRGGSQGMPVSFKADGKQVRIVRRNRRTPDGINVEGASYVLIEGFIVDDMPRAGVRAVNGSHVTIRGIRAAHNDAWGIFTAHCDDVAIIGNQVSGSVKEHGIYVSNSGDRPVIRGNVLWGNRGCGIHMNGDIGQGGDGIISGAIVENNVIFENGKAGGSGINCDGVQASKLQNNLLYNNYSSGISLYRIDGAAGSTGNFVINNTIVQPAQARWAINITDNSTSNVVLNNILLHTGSKGSFNISADSLAGLRSDYNVVIDRVSPDAGGRFITLTEWQSATAMDRHSVVSKPQDLFVNFASNDFHLHAGSPAVDKADPATAAGVDIDGRTRPRGAGPDMGACEF